jgi:hypothetical protein
LRTRQRNTPATNTIPALNARVPQGRVPPSDGAALVGVTRAVALGAGTVDVAVAADVAVAGTTVGVADGGTSVGVLVGLDRGVGVSVWGKGVTVDVAVTGTIVGVAGNGGNHKTCPT